MVYNFLASFEFWQVIYELVEIGNMILIFKPDKIVVIAFTSEVKTFVCCVSSAK